MPGRVRVAEAEIVARDRTRGGTRSAINNFEQLHSVVRDNWWGVRNLGDAFAGLGAIVAGGFGVAAKAAIDFETGMAGVARTTRVAAQEGESMVEAQERNAAVAAGIAEQLRKIATETPVDTGRLTAIAEEAGALGVAAEDIGAFTGTIAKLTATTNLTDASAAQLARIGGVMNISASAVSNLGSAILFAGRSTAATETEIVQFAQYLAPVAAAANASTGELIGMSAVLKSLGVRADAGRTAISKTILDMGKAFRQGGDDATLFANTAGKSVEEFQAIFAENGFQAVDLFVKGLNRLGTGSEAAEQVLSDLGVVETRQLQTLRALSAGYDNTTNKMVHLDEAMRATTAAYQENTELTEAYKIATDTTAAQMQILRNNVADLAISLGQVLLPAIRFIVEGLQDFVVGIDQLPGPVKAITLVSLALAGVIGLIGAAFLLLAPRIVLVMGAFRQFQTQYAAFAASAGNASAILASANNATALSATRAAFAYGRMNAVQREAALVAYQEANARKIGNVVHAEAIRINELYNAIKAREILLAQQTSAAKAAEVAQTAALLRAKQAETAAFALGAKIRTLEIAQSGQMARAASLEAAGRTALADRARAAAAATGAQIAALRGEIVVRGQAAAAARAEAATAGLRLQSANADIVATNRIIASLRARIAARGAAATAAQQQAIAEMQAAGATSKMATGAGLLGRVLGKLTLPLLLLTTLLPLATGLIGKSGDAHRDAAAAAKDNTRAQADFAKAIQDQRAGNKAAVQQFIANKLAADGAVKAAEKYGITLEQIASVVNGNATDAASAEMAARLAEGFQKGDDAAGKAYNSISKLREMVQNAGLSTEDLGVSMDGAAEDTEGLAEAAADAKKALDELRETNNSINAALLALPGAILAQREAAVAAQEAMDEYSETMRTTANVAYRVAEAEEAVRDAQRESEQAAEEVAQAEEDLATARQRGLDDYADAVDDYADAQDDYVESVRKVQELEQDLEDLRNGGSAEDLAKATLELADAHLKLRNAQLGVRDAQYMLNYLQAEGASARDMEEAQLDLDEANQDLAQSTNDLTEAQKELYDLENPDPAVIADAERELASARRDVAEASREISSTERDLADARQAIADDTYYRDAERDLASARYDAEQAARDLGDAERTLAEERTGNPAAAEARRATQDLEDAYYDLAEANVEVQKQTALSRGETFGLGREALALSGELAALGSTLGGTIGADFATFSGLLATARADIGQTGDALEGLEQSALDGIEGAQNALTTSGGWGETLEPKGGEAGDGFFQGFLDKFTMLPIYEALLRGDWAGAQVAFKEYLVNWLPFLPAIEDYFARTPIGQILGDLLQLLIPAPLQVMYTKFMEHFQPGAWIAEKLGLEEPVSTGDMTRFLLAIIFPGPTAMYTFFKENFHPRTWLKEIFDRDTPSSSKDSENLGATLGGALRTGFINWLAGRFSFVGILRELLTRDSAQSSEDSRSFGESLGKWLMFGLVSSLGGLGQLMREAIWRAMSMLPEWVKGPINTAIGYWNWFIDWLSSRTIKFPAVDLPGGIRFGGWEVGLGYLKGLQIPQLAHGGVATGPTLAMIGEGRSDELVMPLDKFWDQLDPLMQMANDLRGLDDALLAVSGGGRGDVYNNITVNVETDADAYEIGREILWNQMVRLR